MYAIIRKIFKRGEISEYFHWVAFSIDQMGNVMGAPIMNDVLLKKTSKHKYGNPDETISHVTGVNYVAKKLTTPGYFVAHCLNAVDRNHVEKAAENNQQN
jgi:hypothetical protein